MILSWKAVRRGVLLAAVVAVLSSLMVASVSAQAPQLPPNRYYGSVTLDGAAAPAGATVTATINGNNCAEAATVAADGSYVLTVLSEGVGATGCGTAAATIQFLVNGCDAGTASFTSGQYAELDLDAVCAAPPTEVPPTEVPPTVVPPTETPVVTPAPGSGGYLGGGGTAWWLYAAGGLGLLLLGTAGATAFRRYAR